MNSSKAASLESSTVQSKKVNDIAYLHGNIEILHVSKIKCNVKTQQRTGLNLQTIEEYKEAISLGAKFPPVKVCFDGKNYYLWDGFHTVQVYSQLEKTEIEAEVSQGTLRDAILLSVGANYNHGLRRAREDKRKAVKALLYDDEWMMWSNREIAKKCHVSESLVRAVKKEIGFKNEKVVYQDQYGNQSQRKVSSSENDDTITDAFKRISNPENDKPIMTGEKRSDQNSNTKELSDPAMVAQDKPQKVLITNGWKKGEEGVIVQSINANSSLIQLKDGTSDIVQKYDYKMIDDKLDSLVNLASQGFERQKINFQENDIVLIDPTNRIDDRLVGYAKRYAQIIKLNDYSADVTIWGKTIETVPLTDLTPIPQEAIIANLSIKPRVYAQLMANFSSLEQALDYALSKKNQHPGFSKIFN